MRPTLPLLAVLVGLGFTGLHCAYADTPPPHASNGAVYEHPSPAVAVPRIELVDDGAQVLPTFEQGGRRYVLGEMGQRYQVRVVNPTPSRVEAVVSIDGLDAVDGRPGNLNKRGYIVPAYGEVTIDGFPHLPRHGGGVSLLVGSRLVCCPHAPCAKCRCRRGRVLRRATPSRRSLRAASPSPRGPGVCRRGLRAGPRREPSGPEARGREQSGERRRDRRSPWPRNAVRRVTRIARGGDRLRSRDLFADDAVRAAVRRPRRALLARHPARPAGA